MSRKQRTRPERLNMAATLPAPALQRKSFGVYAPDIAYDTAMPTDDQIHKMFGPVKTLGLPIAQADAMHLAMDEALEHSGFYSLIQHAFSLGQPPQGNGFIGYAALSDLKQNGLISACVETVVDDMLREWIEIERAGGKVDEDSDGEDDAIPDIEEAVKSFRLRHAFREAAALTQYFGGCLIFIDTGVTDPEALKKPLDISDKSGELGMGKLRGFTVIEPINIFPGNYNSLDPLRRDYFEPRSWWVLGREVHASRFIKISSGDVPVLLRPSYNFFGVPHAQILWDYVLHFQKDRVATSRMLSKYSDFIFKIGGLQDAMTTPGGTAVLERRLGIMSRYRSNDGIAAIDKENEDVVKVESSLAGLVDITRQDLGFLCAINRTPAEKLLGEPPPGFNSTGASSIRNYYDHISSQQEKILYDGVAKALDCIQLHVTGRIDSSISFHFTELGGEDRQIESGIRKANTDTLAALVMAEIVTPDGARAAIEANPDEYLAGLTDGIKADREAMEAVAEGELDGMEAGSFGEPVPGQEPPRKEEILEVRDEKIPALDEFKEANVKRDKGGKFSEQAGGGGKTSKEGSAGKESGKAPSAGHAASNTTGKGDYKAAAGQILNEMAKDPKAKYGLRVIPEEYTKSTENGERLENSYKWKNGEQTNTQLNGTSTIKIDSADEKSLYKAMRDLGVASPEGMQKRYNSYFGNKIVLVKGTSVSKGHDEGEGVIKNAIVVGSWAKSNGGNGSEEIAPNKG